MAQSDLWSRLLAEARFDVPAEAARYAKETGNDDPDRFLSWLHGQRKISDSLFAELATGGGVSVSRFKGVKDRTLLLEPPAKTLILPASLPTILAGPAVTADGTRPGSPPPSDPARQHYTLLGCLGKGAMGEVHVARDEDLLRKVAYKKMVPEVAGSSALAARFFSEIQVTAQLDHPNIVPIYGLEVTADGALGYSMKLVQGQTLAQLLDGAREDAGRAHGLAARLDIFLKVCDAMAYAHSKGVLHRDLKPENIMVGRYNEVYVMDWGICRVIGSDDPAADKVELATAAKAAPNDRTQFGAVLGTPSYMSPEQASGLNADLDGRSDVYALGLILYEVIALEQAVTGATLEAVLARAATGDKDTFAFPRELGGIVARATAFARNARYPSASALADDLRRHLRGEAPLAAPDSPLAKLARGVARHRALALAGILLLFVAAAGGTIGVLVHEKNALAHARRHEEAVQAFAAAVAAQSHAIDNHFLEDQALLTGLAGRAAALIANPPPSATLGDATVYLSQEYEAGRGPPDVVASPYYGRPVSFGWATIVLPPGVDRPARADDVRLAGPLRTPMANVLLGDVGGDPLTARARLLAHGGTLLRVFVTLASGVHMSYPGMGGFPADYDGRKRPKYKLAAGKKGVFWGSPYPDQFGHGLLLPMSTSLYDDDGALLGVCGADTTFTFIKDNLLELHGGAAVENEYLVDEQGRVVVDRRSQAAALRSAGNEAVALEPLAEPAVVAAIRARRDGDIVTSGGKLIAYDRLAALGWYYVVVADEHRLLDSR